MSARSPGEKLRRQRKREREAVTYEALMAPLRATGATCANCVHIKRYGWDRTEHECVEKRDGEWHVIVKPDDLCPLHRLRPTTPPGGQNDGE